MHFNDAWRHLLSNLLRNGKTVAPRGQKTLEIVGNRLDIENMQDSILGVPARNLNYRFAIAEALWIAYGRNDVATLAQYNSRMARFSDDGETLAGAYGPRIKAQLQYVVDTIRRDAVTRQAVMTIWKPCPPPSKDIPCTVSMQFLPRDGRLHAVVGMRSSDAWLGIPYDVFSFSFIGNCIAAECGLQPGRLTIYMGSSHLYETHWAEVEKLLWVDGPGADFKVRMPALPGLPPSQLELMLEDPRQVGLFSYPWHLFATALGGEIENGRWRPHTRSEALSYLQAADPTLRNAA